MMDYWPEHKVFFIATLALYPDKLKDQIITEIFYRPYFPSDDIDHIGIMLKEYKKQGYVDYVYDGEYAFKITNIDTINAINDLIEYLKRWGLNRLHTPSANKPPDATYQQKLLIKAVTEARTRNENVPRVNLANIYGKTSELAFTPTFWELVLYNHLISRKVKVELIGYDKSFSGLYKKKPIPFADIIIKDKELEAATLPKLKNDEAESRFSPGQNYQAKVIIKDNMIYAVLNNGEEIPVSRSLRSDMSPYKFINHVLNHPESYISRQDIKEITETSDITELIRRCGFNRHLKKIFFPNTTEQKVYFRPTIDLTESQKRVLDEHKWDKVRLSGKQN